MPQLRQPRLAVDPSEGSWVLAADGQDVAGGLASSPLAMPAFFLGWIAVGVSVALVLARRGHDCRTMVALGVGLGPLMFVVASDAVRRREREARPLVLSPGVDHGGDLDILVLIQHSPEHVRSLAPTLSAVESEVGTLTLARAVEYEWLDDAPEDHADNEVVASASSALVTARDLVPISSPALVVFPGTVEAAARRFAARRHRTLILVAIDDPTAAPGHR